MGPTEICNMALARIGANRINDYGDDTDTQTEAIQCRTHYEQTAKALMRSHFWRFAKRRVQLTQDANDPAFQWSYAYLLPADFLRLIMVWDGTGEPDGSTRYHFELEGSLLLWDVSTCYIKYVRWVPEVPSWDPMFTEVMILKLARKLCIPLSQDVKVMKQDLDKDLKPLESKVRAMDREEGETIGREALKIWLDAKYSDTP